MRTRSRSTFTTIHTEGALLPVDLLLRVSRADPDLDGTTPTSYHLAPGEKINEAINRSWNRLSGLWTTFSAVRADLPADDPATTLTRERWLLPLFQELGFGRLSVAKAVEIGGKSYPISHRWEQVPIHLVGCGLPLDRRTPGAAGAARVSPHSLMQEYLNRAPHARWGLLSNGLSLRVLRDNASLTRQAYLDFDLAAMFEGEVYADFVLLWLVCHQSRFEPAPAPDGSQVQAGDCFLERWSLAARQSGTRALEELRNGVEGAINALGRGFMQQRANQRLQERLKSGELSAHNYYRQLLRLVYRLIFLFTAEDRDLLLLPDAPAAARQRYQAYFSTARLRTLAERQRGTRHPDCYEVLKLIMRLLGSKEGCADLALPALGGWLFSRQATPELDEAELDNRSLLEAVRALAFIREGRTLRAVDYRNLGSEELGSVYESLLELHPQFNREDGTFKLITAAGSERKTTGSHYTPPDLVNELIGSALDPVIEARLKGAKDRAEQEDALLSLTVCDPACGSGHFLVAAAHRIAARLAQVRADGGEPSPAETRAALREVIRRCLYGVDINPMAVELCRINLWLESLEPGKPLSFLDAHIQCGDSLVGAGPGTDYTRIPDEAFEPVFGDHKATARYLKRRNRQERAGLVELLPSVFVSTENGEAADMARAWARLEVLPEDNVEQSRARQAEYERLLTSRRYEEQRTACDLWTAAFFWPMEEQRGRADVYAPTQAILSQYLNGQPVPKEIMDKAGQIASEQRFFHWELAFPHIFSHPQGGAGMECGGFDCVLGNPPWEMMQLEEQEFFAIRDPEIAALPGAQRKRAIENLINNNPDLWQSFVTARHIADAKNKFARESQCYPLTASGKMNTYALFAEHARALVNVQGRVGIIVPTGIATDDSTKQFFADLGEKHSLASLYDFENREKLFSAVDSRYKLSLLTLRSQPQVDEKDEGAQFVFFATRVEHLRDPRRRFTLTPEDIALVNPNTRTLPVFRTRQDAELTRAIYKRVPVLVNEQTGENPWGVSFKQGLFNMTSDSHLFATEPRPGYVRLYEDWMIHLYDHRYQTNGGIETSLVDHQNPSYTMKPRYWVDYDHLSRKINTGQEKEYFLIFRNRTRNTDIRSVISAIVPILAIGNTTPIIFTDINNDHLLFGNLSAMVFDYFARQKISGLNLNFFFFKQFPIIPPSNFSKEIVLDLSVRIFELTYTAWDVQPFADKLWLQASPELRVALSKQWEQNAAATDGGHRGAQCPEWAGPPREDGFPYPPFKWDEARRAVLRAELDAYYARLYGLNRKQLRYILDPADLTGRELEDILDPWEEVTDPLDPAGYDMRRAASDFPGETFRVLKEKELRQFGEYRTRRLVLEAWERLKDEEIGD